MWPENQGNVVCAHGRVVTFEDFLHVNATALGRHKSYLEQTMTPKKTLLILPNIVY